MIVLLADRSGDLYDKRHETGQTRFLPLPGGWGCIALESSCVPHVIVYSFGVRPDSPVQLLIQGSSPS